MFHFLEFKCWFDYFHVFDHELELVPLSLNVVVRVWQKGTERGNQKGTERGTERRFRFWWKERNGKFWVNFYENWVKFSKIWFWLSIFEESACFGLVPDKNMSCNIKLRLIIRNRNCYGTERERNGQFFGTTHTLVVVMILIVLHDLSTMLTVII